jgi:hypothetical protein
MMSAARLSEGGQPSTSWVPKRVRMTQPVAHYTEDRVYGPVDLTVGDDIYDFMMHRLAGYFMLKPEAESRKLTPQTIRKRADSNVRAYRGRSGSKITGHGLNVQWTDYESGEVLHSDVNVSNFVKHRMSELAQKSRQKVKDIHEHAGGSKFNLDSIEADALPLK